MIKSAYGVFFKHFFIYDLFFGNFSNIKNAFHFLDSPKCIEELLYSGCTDFQLRHPEFWRHSIDCMNQDDKVLLKKVLENYRIEYDDDSPDRWLWDYHKKGRKYEHYVYIDDELKNDLIKELYPIAAQFKPLFIKNLGQLYISRASIPFIWRKSAFNFLSSIDNLCYGLADGFGLNKTQDSRYAHIPISVQINKKVNVQSNSNKLNKIQVRNNTMLLDCKMRVHIFPYGLITVYFIYSISSDKDFEKYEIIETVNQLLSKSKNGKVNFTFNKKQFKTICDIFEYIRINIFDSIYISNPSDFNDFSRLFSFLTLNIDKKYREKHIAIQDILKILTHDSTDLDYDPSFEKSYSSLLGKYRNDFAFSTSERIIMSLTTQWENYRKRKTKVRYYWLFLHIYQFVSGIKYLSPIFLTMLNGKKKNFVLNDKNIDRIHDWILFIQYQHISLNSIYRRFFYKIQKIHSIHDYIEKLTNSLHQLQIEQNQSNYKTVQKNVKKLHNRRSLEIDEYRRMKVFISYARDDAKNAFEIYKILKENDYNPWIDIIDLLPGQEWKIEIQKAIKESDYFIACFSNKSVSKSGFYQTSNSRLMLKSFKITG